MAAHKNSVKATLWLLMLLLLFPCFALAYPDVYEDDNSRERAAFIIPNGSSQRHNFHTYADADWIKFYGIYGMPYAIRANNLSYECDIALELYDRSGNKILWIDDNYWGEEEYLEWVCPASGFYFIKAYNADSAIFGSGVGYDLRIVIPTGCMDSGIQGIVTDASDGKAIAGANIRFRLIRSLRDIAERADVQPRCFRESGSSDNIFSDKDGYYSISLDPGDYELTVQAIGYKPSSFQEKIYYGSALDGSIALYRDMQSCDSLSDAISILKIFSGMNIDPPICLQNQKIEMAQAICILQMIAGLR